MSDTARKSYSHIPEGDVAAFAEEHSEPYNPETDEYRRPPFAASVKAGKNTAVYRAHAYHTKVPPQGIVPYIEHYTEPGDLVLDPFCGSGMTGVASLTTGRAIILNDLSPAAIHIAYNYCAPVDLQALDAEYHRIRAVVQQEFDWLYGTTCDRCGGPATICYTVWSEVFECRRCGHSLLFWDVAVDSKSGTVEEVLECPECGKEWRKAELNRLEPEPVVTDYECSRCTPKRHKHPVTEAELDRIKEIAAKDIPYWYPDTIFDSFREQYVRDSLSSHGIETTADFFTKRNLWALARLWGELQESGPTLRSHLIFWFTSYTWLVSRMYRYRRGGGGGQQGRLTIPSVSKEQNVLKAAARKYRNIRRYFAQYTPADVSFVVNVGSATDMQDIPDAAVDYVFTDPPFGQNLYYSDLNFLWESWLGEHTDPRPEAVVHREQKRDAKTPEDYADLMTASFCEMCRVLKPGRWASVVFHNSDDRIWQVILDAAEDAGFELAEINSFDKKQLSFKGVRGDKGLERVTNQDIVLNLYKPSSQKPRIVNDVPPSEDLEAQVAQQVADFLATNPPPGDRTLQHIWNHVLYDMIANGAVQFSMADVDRMLPYYFKEVDGRWYLRGEAVVGGHVFDIRSETDAITWLTAVLEHEPKTTGDLIPEWQKATYQAGDAITKSLDQILEENFWQDRRTRRWRIPTPAEREKMSARQEVTDRARARKIRRYLAGELDLQPTSIELCGWVQFAYEHGMFEEAVRVFANVHQPDVNEELYRKTRKIAQASQMRAGRSDDGSQLRLF